jgi:hypothetical protein
MADTTFSANQTLRGTNGRLWINESLMANVKKFEAKIKAVYEDVDSTNPGKDRVIVGYEISGTMTFNKVDSYFANLLADSWKTLTNPDITIIAKNTDAEGTSNERIKLTGVTIDELPFGFEVKKLSDEEIAFAASSFEYLDTI